MAPIAAECQPTVTIGQITEQLSINEIQPRCVPNSALKLSPCEAGLIHTAADGPGCGPSGAELGAGASPLPHFPNMAICLQVSFKPLLQLTETWPATSLQREVLSYLDR